MTHHNSVFNHDHAHERVMEDTSPAVAGARSIYQRNPATVLDFMEALCDHLHLRQYREEFIANRELLAEYANRRYFVPEVISPLDFSKAPRLVRLLLKQRRLERCYNSRRDYSDRAYDVIKLVRPLLVGGWKHGMVWAQLTVQRSLLLVWYPRRGEDPLAELDIAAKKIRDIHRLSTRVANYRALGFVFWKQHQPLRSIWYYLKSVAASARG